MNDVERAFAEGHTESVPDEARRRGAADMLHPIVQRSHVRLGKLALDDSGHVAGGGPDIKHSELVGQIQASQGFSRRFMAA